MDEINPKLIEASVVGVLGEYDHSIKLGADDDFIIVYGPNGVGKTKFLEIIDALSRLQGFALSTLPFDSAKIKYSDGSELSVMRSEADTDTSNQRPSFPLLPTVNFVLRRRGKKPVSWAHNDDEFTDYLRRNGRYEQISDVNWQDASDGEILHIDVLRARYEGRPFSKKRKESSAPDPVIAFVKQVPSFLIETQRLRTELTNTVKSPRLGYRGRSDQRGSSSRINDQAETIRTLLNGAQTEHSRITQQLDRTFPNRVLGAAAKDQNLNQDAIRSRYDVQNEFRSRLGRVASVSLDDELALPTGDLDSWALTLLNQYLEDADKKLAPFEDLLQKIELLEQIINDRLLNKSLRVTDGEGLSVVHAHTDRPIALESLSSGEQHEIILMIDLLFNTPKGAVVLIDEPEISLHVAWQIAFIPDVEKIADLAGFRFVVATHSPQIINDQWHKAIRLGPEEISF